MRDRSPSPSGGGGRVGGADLTTSSARSADGVGRARQLIHRHPPRRTAPTRSLRDHPPPAGEGDQGDFLLRSKPRPDARPAPEPPAPPDRIDLFAPAPVDEPDATDPAALARAATLASGRAMKGRLWTEARALAGLAESYARLGERARGGGQSIETMDLALIFEVLADDHGVAARRLALNPDRLDDPDRAIKEEYQRRLSEVRQNQTHHHMAMVRRIHAAEAQIRALGGTIEVSQSGFDAMAEARDWLLSATDELEDVTVTPSPPPGDPWKVGM